MNSDVVEVDSWARAPRAEAARRAIEERIVILDLWRELVVSIWCLVQWIMDYGLWIEDTFNEKWKERLLYELQDCSFSQLETAAPYAKNPSSASIQCLDACLKN